MNTSTTAEPALLTAVTFYTSVWNLLKTTSPDLQELFEKYLQFWVNQFLILRRFYISWHNTFVLLITDI
jgi:hypothetical protein